MVLTSDWSGQKAALELSDGGVRRQWITVESRVYGGDMYITRPIY